MKAGRWHQPEHVEPNTTTIENGINTRIILQITKGTSVHRGTVCAWIIAIYNPYRCDHVRPNLLLIERRAKRKTFKYRENFPVIFTHYSSFYVEDPVPTDRRSKGNSRGWGNYRPVDGGNNYPALLHS